MGAWVCVDEMLMCICRPTRDAHVWIYVNQVVIVWMVIDEDIMRVVGCLSGGRGNMIAHGARHGGAQPQGARPCGLEFRVDAHHKGRARAVWWR